MAKQKMTAQSVAELLERIADLLEAGDDNPFRIQSYRDAARTVRQTDAPVVQLARDGDMAGLKELPDIGERLAGLIVEFVQSGRSALLDDLQARVQPQTVLQRVPGLGPELAQRIVSQLDVSTLEELEQAAHDGRLQNVPGFGPRRLQAVRDGLAGMLGRRGRRRRPPVARPTVETLLQIDADYRRRAAADELQRIAPRRFNPQGEAWLPIMRAERDGWRFTALFSNTARAHELGKTGDWVVIYYEATGGGEERQNTVVTESSGPLAGKRVVRGRQSETRDFYN